MDGWNEQEEVSYQKRIIHAMNGSINILIIDFVKS